VVKKPGGNKMGKVAGLARALAILLALVAAFVPLAGLNTALVLVVLGLIAGLAYGEDSVVRLLLTVLVLPAVGSALGNIPVIGSQLSAFAGGLGLAAASAAATVIAIRLYHLVKDGIMGLTAK
jgi:hypothetical protein